MSQAAIRELAHDQLLPAFKTERERLDRIDRWYRWDHEEFRLPKGATPEHKALMELARTPWLGLVVSNVAQNMYVDGYRTPDVQTDAEGPWRTWQRNQMDSRQVALHRGALAYGHAYATILPGELEGERAAVIRGVSPRKMLAVYADPAEDEWPLYAIRCEPSKTETALRVYDEEAVYYLAARKTDNGNVEVEYISYDVHDVGVCPVNRYSHVDLEGRDPGQVEPFIPIAARIDKTSYDRLLAQHFNSWKIRTIAGMSLPEDKEDANRERLKLQQSDFLVAEDADTTFGTLDETPLGGFIDAHEADVKSLAAVSQTPTHALTGDLINLSAEALAAARAELGHKVREFRVAYGSAHDRTLRLSAHIEGNGSAAADYMSHVTWQDTEVRSWSQAVDALGKAATLLQIPVEALWNLMPGVTKLDVDEWRRMARQQTSAAAVSSIAAAAQAARARAPQEPQPAA